MTPSAALLALRQHAQRVHAEPIKGPLIRYSTGPIESGLALPIVAALAAATSVRRRR